MCKLSAKEERARTRRRRFFAARARAAEYGGFGAFQPLAFSAADNERAPLRQGTNTTATVTLLCIAPYRSMPRAPPSRPLPPLHAFPFPRCQQVAARANTTDTTWHVLGHVDRPRHPRDLWRSSFTSYPSYQIANITSLFDRDFYNSLVKKKNNII